MIVLPCDYSHYIWIRLVLYNFSILFRVYLAARLAYLAYIITSNMILYFDLTQEAHEKKKKKK